MAINYLGFIGKIQKAQDGRDYTVELYKGVIGGQHKYRVRFMDDGSVKTVSYGDIFNNRVKNADFKVTNNPNKKKMVKKEKKVVDTSYKNVLSLDAGTSKTGYSAFINYKYKESGVISSCKKFRFQRISEMLNGVKILLSKYNINFIGIEDIYLGEREFERIKVYKALANLQGALCTEFVNLNMSFELVHVKEWRAFYNISGDRWQCKDMAIKACQEILGKTLSDDEAEAFLIGNYLIRR